MPLQQTAGTTGPGPLLGPDDPDPVGEINADSRSPFFLICDHAGNAVPKALNRLGLPDSELGRHIGIDIGALGVAKGLAQRLSAPLVYQRYSRLVVDSNRRPEASASMAEIADGTEVPGNRGLDAAARTARVEAILRPYHDRIGERLDARQAAALPTLLISVHSFTPALRARPGPRPWNVGLCYGRDRRLTERVLEELRRAGNLEIGENEPYTVDMENDYSIPVHAEARGLPYIELEIRQDQLAGAAEQEAWAERLAAVLQRAAEDFVPSAAS